eukprot:TRINITY_DN13763_c0_g1_i1.p1 TRINITY_DN13763_c0_g1~~TRINITY_DN13763_c0_g1_i1.p1  ORF type:complete len:531 (+),score=185.67 TRINITY_DN13763_c0_g1_i1:87-1679(+)
MAAIALGWIIFAIVLVAVLLMCFMVVKYYEDRLESEKFPTFITTVAIALSLYCIFLIPLDIFMVSRTQDSNGNKIDAQEIEYTTSLVRYGYYTLYSLVLLFSFVLIPFAYFYYEEDDENITLKEKVVAGCKYTLFLLVIIVILFVVGLILYTVNPGDKPTSITNTKDWLKHIVNDTNIFESGISFAIACLTTVGFISWISYTAYGLSAFPIGIIRGRKHVTEDASDLQSDLESTREKQRALKSKYLGGKRISRKDESTLNLLDRKEKVLKRQGERLNNMSSGWRSVFVCLKPFFFLFGIIFFLGSLLIFLSILLTSIDKAVQSNAHNLCQSTTACGYVLNNPSIFNPVDQLLLKVAPYFPLDYVIVGLIVIYVFLATLSGVVKVGIRFLWINLFSIRKGRSPPQGLLLAAVILMLSCLALNIEISSLAPTYSSFGTQTWNEPIINSVTNQTEIKYNQPCSMKAPRSNCTMTQIATIVNRISIRTSFFGVIYFYATWIFLICFIIGIFISLFKAKSSNIERRDGDSDEDEY